MARGRMHILAGLVRPEDLLPVVDDTMTTAEGFDDPLSINFPDIWAIPSWIEDRDAEYVIFDSGHDTQTIRYWQTDEFLGPYATTSPKSTNLTVTMLKAWGYWSTPVVTTITDEHIGSLSIYKFDEDTGYVYATIHGLIDIAAVQAGSPFFGTYGSQADHNTWIVRSRNLKDDWEIVAGPVGKVFGEPFFFRPFYYLGDLYAVGSGGELRKADNPTGLSNWSLQSGHGSSSDNAKWFSLLVRNDGTVPPYEPRHYGWDFSRLSEAILIGYVCFRGQDPPPERILYFQVDLSGDWNNWQMPAIFEFAAPLLDWEGIDVPLRITGVGEVDWPAQVTMDPANIITVNGIRYMCYCGGGEHTNAIAELNELTTG